MRIRTTVVFVLFSCSAVWGWSAKVNLSNLAAGSRAFAPRAAVDSSSNVHVVYPGGVDPSTSWRANYTFYNGTSWSAPIIVPGSAAGVGNCDIAVDGSNNLHVVWSGYANPEEVYYCKRTSGTWGSVVNLSATTERSIVPHISVNPAGTVIMVCWHESNQVGATYDIFAKKYSSGAWGTTTNISSDTGLSGYPNVSIDSAGNFVVSWQDTTTNHSYFRRHTTAGVWEAKTQIDATSHRAYGPDNYVTADGTIHFAWLDDSIGEWEIYYRNRNSAGTMSSILNIANHSGITDADPSIRADSNSNIHVVWHDYDDIWYTYTAGGVWQPKVKISDATSQNSPQIVMTPSGNEHVVWQYSNGTNWNVYWSWQAIPSAPPPAYQASFVSLSAPTTMTPGSTATITATFINNGANTWDTTNTKVGTSNPRDRSSAFYNAADWLTAARPTRVDAATAPNTTGTFTFIALAPATPGAYAEKFELVQEGVTWFEGTGEDFTWNVTVLNPTGTITGNVKDACAVNLSGATVSTTVGGYTTTTDASGNYTLSNVTNGTYTVQAAKTGYTTQSTNATVAGNTVTKNFTLPYASVGTISGTIVDNCGAAVSGATVSTTTGCWSTTTAANGTYALSSVAVGTYTVQAVKSGYTTGSQAGVSVTNGGTATVNLTLNPSSVGTISGTVTDGCGAAISGATVSTTTGCYSTTTAANGTYTLSGVAAATYTVQFVKSGFTTATTTGVVVTGGGTTTVNKTLVASALGTISGTVTDACGAAISGATVSTTTGCYSTTTAANGTYTLSNVPAATYTVQFSKSGYTTATTTGVVVTGGGTTTANKILAFASVGTISGTVTASGGGAISGATVSTTTGCWSTTTAANGTYTLSNVAAGTYTVQAVKSGYNTGTQSGVVVTNGVTTTVNFTLTPNAPFEHVSNGNMEGGFFATGWASTCSGQTSKLPNPSGTWGWNEDATYPFNTYDKTGTVHGGTHSLGFSFCQTSGDPGKLGIVYQSINLGAPNATGTFSCWGYNTNGNCPSIMCWNPGNNQTDPYVANSGGRLLWICGAGNNWTTLNTWQTNAMTVTADSSGYVTIMMGGASWPGTSSGAPLYIDDVSVMAP